MYIRLFGPILSQDLYQGFTDRLALVRHGPRFVRTKEGFQIDSGYMVLSANEELSERVSANHSAAWKNQFETPPPE